MKRRQTRRNRDERSEKRSAYIFIAASVMIVVGIVLTIFAFPSDSVDELGCSKPSPSAHTIVVIDTTDALTDIQLKNIQIYLKGLILGTDAAFPKGYLITPLVGNERLTVLKLGGDSELFGKPIFDACRPSDVTTFVDGNSQSDVFLGFLKGGNPLKAAKRFQEGFVELFDNRLKSAATSASASESPIFEMLQHANLIFKQNTKNVPKRIILVSDLLHNTRNYSVFRDRYALEQLANSPYFQKIRTDLAGVDVYPWVIYHRPEFQRGELLRFWELFLTNQRAKVPAFLKVEG